MEKQELLKKPKSKMKTAFLWVSFFFLLFLLMTSILGPVLQKSSLESHGPLGDLYEVDGRQMHLYCVGDAGPSVVLSADLLGGTLSWSFLQKELSPYVRVCSYDRAGIAWSEASVEEQSLESMANDLNDLLIAAGEQGPFVLLGQGFGGAIVRKFMTVYPEKVAALVLLDSQARDVMLEFLADDLVNLEKSDSVNYQKYKNSELLAQLGLLRLLPGIHPSYMHLDLYDEATRGLWQAIMHRDYWKTVLAEWQIWQNSKNELSNEPLFLGEKPLLILAADYLEEEWPLYGDIDMKDLYDKQILAQQELLRLSHDNSMLVLKGVGHDIAVLAATMIKDNVLQLLEKLRTQIDSANETAGESDLVEISL